MQLTDFKKLFDDEIAKSKANSSSVPQNHLFLRQFREAIWVCFLTVFEKGKKKCFYWISANYIDVLIVLSCISFLP